MLVIPPWNLIKFLLSPVSSEPLKLALADHIPRLVRVTATEAAILRLLLLLSSKLRSIEGLRALLLLHSPKSLLLPRIESARRPVVRHSRHHSSLVCILHRELL